MQRPLVVLIGGPPGAGKTTLGCALAARIGGSSVSIDDLLTVAKATGNPETHPDLFLYRGVSHLEYFTDSTPERLQRDAERQSAAAWPIVRSLIQKRVRFGEKPIVIDGWYLRPSRVAAVESETVVSNWIHIEPGALMGRERRNTDFLEGSSDPDRMFRNFMSRSLWVNDLVLEQAEGHGMTVLHQPGDLPVEELCDLALARLPRSSATEGQ